MRIGFFTDSYSPQVNGVVTSIVPMRKELRDRGNRVFVFAPNAKGAVRERDTFYYNSYVFPFYPEYRMALFAYKRAYRDAISVGLDIVHTFTSVFLGVASIVSSRRLKVPLVGTFPTLIPDFVSLFYGRAIAFFTKPVLWKLITDFYRKCDVVTVPTEYTRQVLLEKGVDSVVTPHGIDFNELGKPRKNIRKEWNISENEFLILHVGRLSCEKKVMDILRSAVKVTSENKRVKYIILSDGPQRKELECFVRRKGLQDRVVFTGFVPQKDLSSYYSQSDLFVSASPFETQGLAVIEAMYFGKPVIVVNAGALREVVTDGKTGLQYDGRVEELTEKINVIINDSRLRSRLCRNARSEALGYELKKCTDRFKKIYDSLI